MLSLWGSSLSNSIRLVFPWHIAHTQENKRHEKRRNDAKGYEREREGGREGGEGDRARKGGESAQMTILLCFLSFRSESECEMNSISVWYPRPSAISLSSLP